MKKAESDYSAPVKRRKRLYGSPAKIAGETTMLCCVCKKNRAEKVCEKTAGGKTERAYYCSDCYRRLFKNAARQTETGADGRGQTQPVRENVKNSPGEEESAAIKKARCPFCGTSVADYESTRLFGCPDCYRYLFDFVKDDVFLLQGGEPHSGKRPQNFTAQNARGAAERSGKADTARTKEKGRV